MSNRPTMADTVLMNHGFMMTLLDKENGKFVCASSAIDT